MEKVAFTYKSGRERVMSAREANILSKLKKGTYLTRDMAHQPSAVIVQKESVTSNIPAEDAIENEDVVQDQAVADDLEDMEKAELHALAKDLGVDVHHNAGAVKVREAIRAKRAEAT